LGGTHCQLCLGNLERGGKTNFGFADVTDNPAHDWVIQHCDQWLDVTNDIIFCR